MLRVVLALLARASALVTRKEAVLARATALHVDKMLVLVVLDVVLGKV